ncbi:MAG: DUF2721 domain-containing protein [Myxococcota bacterium]
MASLSEAITSSLAPGIALTAVIFYNSSLQNRFIYITGRMREVNREARALRAAGDAASAPRVASLWRQVSLMARRTRILRRAILTVYVALISVVLTILEVFLAVVVHPPGLETLALGTFAFALCAMATAAGISWTENFLSMRTIVEDVESSFGQPPDGR